MCVVETSRRSLPISNGRLRRIWRLDWSSLRWRISDRRFDASSTVRLESNDATTRVYGDTVDSDKISERISRCSTLCRESAISPSGDSVETTTSNIIIVPI